MKPIIDRANNLKNIVGVDIDKKALQKLQLNLKDKGQKIHLVKGNFIDLSLKPEKYFGLCEFDCVVMNPPFSGRKEEWIEINKNGSKNKITVPIEVAFLINTLRLLKDNGKLLAVLPPSVIASLNNKWVREHVLEVGSIVYVHELPSFSFKGVESRMYIFVFKKTKRQNMITLKNHDLEKPEKVILTLDELGDDIRLDYNYQISKRKYNKIIKNNDNYGWTRLEKLVTIYRGGEKSPDGTDYAFHTNDYKEGFWKVSRRHKLNGCSDSICINTNDLLIKRVGRECSFSLGTIKGYRKVPCTDCILIIRPKVGVSQISLLLELRLVLMTEWGKNIIERGTGASYLTKKDLLNLHIPRKIPKVFKREYSKFKMALKKYDSSMMNKIEKKIIKRMVSN